MTSPRTEKDSRDPQPEAQGRLRAALPTGGLLGRQHQTNPAGLLAGAVPCLLAEQRGIILGRKMRILLLLYSSCRNVGVAHPGPRWDESRCQQKSELIACGDVRCFQQGTVWKKRLPAQNPKSFVKAEPFDPPITSLLHH